MVVEAEVVESEEQVWWVAPTSGVGAGDQDELCLGCIKDVVVAVVE